MQRQSLIIVGVAATACFAFSWMSSLRSSRYRKWGEQAHVAADFHTFSDALDHYKRATGHFPTTSEGLDALVHQPPGVSVWVQTLDRLPRDSWRHPYRYVLTPENPKGYDLFSLGPDGLESADDIHFH